MLEDIDYEVDHNVDRRDDYDASLDEQGAKRAFWDAFRAIGDWHQAQPPY